MYLIFVIVYIQMQALYWLKYHIWAYIGSNRHFLCSLVLLQSIWHLTIYYFSGIYYISCIILHIWGPMYSRVFIWLNFDLYISIFTMYAFVYRYKQNALLLMHGIGSVSKLKDFLEKMEANSQRCLGTSAKVSSSAKSGWPTSAFSLNVSANLCEIVKDAQLSSVGGRDTGEVVMST